MLKIFDENIIVDEGKLIRPSQACFVLIQNGSMELEVNSVRTIYRSSELILFSPMKMYKLIHRTEDIRAYFVLYERETLRNRINVSFNRFSVIHFMNMQQSKDAYPLSKELFRHFWDTTEHLDFYLKNPGYSKFNDEIIIHSFTIIAYIFVDILMKNSTLSTAQMTRKETIVMDFIHLVYDHFTKKRELKFYADKLFISIKYLSICVREITGKAPQVLIANTLMDEAKLMLINTDHNISVIANCLNFSDQYAFGKFFKKHTGLSPRNFRKNLSLTHTI